MATVADAPTQAGAVANEISTAVKHSFVYGVGGVLAKGIGFLMLPLYTHYLIPRDYGILELLDLTTSLMGMFLSMGLSAAFLRYYGAAGSSEEKQKIVSTYLFFTAGTGLLILTAGLLLVQKGTQLLFGPKVSPIYLLLSVIFFVMGYVGTVPYTYLRAKEQSGRLVTLDTLGLLFMLGMNIFFIVVLKLSILGILLSPIICAVIKLAFLFGWMWRDVRLSVDWKRLVQLLGFGGPLVLSNLTMFALNSSDRFFLQRFQSLEVVGVYGVAYKFGFMPNFLLIQQFNMMWQARMYIIHRLPDHRRMFSQVFTLYSLALILAALALALFSPEVMILMVDRRYQGGAQVIPLVSLAYVFLGVGYYLQLGMFLAARTSLVGLASALAAALNLVLNYFLIKAFGMMGAAWATLAGFAALAIASYYLSERVCPLSLGIGRVSKALAMAISVYLLSRALPMPGLGLTLVVKGTLLAVFAGYVWLVRVLSSDELATLSSLQESMVRATNHLWRPAWIGRS